LNRLDIRNNKMSEDEKEKGKKLMPKVEIFF
jgi:hypothetical protein